MKDSEVYNLWNRPPDGTIKVSYYVFNYTNVGGLTLTAQERGNLTEEQLGDEPQDNPNVTQLGPYTYRYNCNSEVE